MTFSVPTWLLPLMLTAVVWLWGVLPAEPARGDYDFAPAIAGMFRLMVCFGATLMLWLMFLVAKVAGFA